MARSYVIQAGDHLRQVSQKFYGDPGLYRKLAAYNGINNPDLLLEGQRLEIPSRTELTGSPKGARPRSPAPATLAGLATPNGLEEIIATFGDLSAFIRDDGTLGPGWEAEYLGRAKLPFPIPLSWDLSKSATSIYCHKKLAEVLSQVFDTLVKEGLRDRITNYGGCFVYRPKRGGFKLSTHSWGIAIDLNPLTNPMGVAGDMDPGVAAVFRNFGFKWGGDWPGKGKDPMHFQFCTGY